MPFDTRRFKNACHNRTTQVAILTTASSTASVTPAVQATVITEHAAAFPTSEIEECYVSAILKADGGAYRGIKETGYFAISFLSRAQVQIADDIYHIRKAALKRITWSERHRIPYLDGSNAAIMCSLRQEVALDANVLIIGHVLDVVLAADPAKPLVNYQRTFRSVDDEAIPVTHPKGRPPNTRL